MAEETLLQEKKDSIEVSRNAKGEYSWKGKIYYDSATEDVDYMIAQLVHINNSLKERFL